MPSPIKRMAFPLFFPRIEIFASSARIAKKLMSTLNLENINSIYSYIYYGFIIADLNPSRVRGTLILAVPLPIVIFRSFPYPFRYLTVDSPRSNFSLPIYSSRSSFNISTNFSANPLGSLAYLLVRDNLFFLLLILLFFFHTFSWQYFLVFIFLF